MLGAALLISAVLALSPMAQIASGASASAALGRWCETHRPGQKLRAERETAVNKPAGKSVRLALRVRTDDLVAYRRVRLTCAGELLSEADNWYAPKRLTPQMNRALETTDTPFGLVVKPLGFTRTTLYARDRTVRALLKRRDGAPFSYVVEDYAPALIPLASR